ncbi:MAG: tetratricopeptide repeat protein [Ferrovibrio sp.]|uniref:tetratricopeptide repeat protein n=1 Tax=Ferrovibrio sp. TaxID=1917215 RepID=UPI00263259EF|nr:tetratricopeptide repeat protein [Ferrovibrio sp.]MCW0233744.1 tetratricopeptide repeat protein [Ferrovibrio sp.]
MSDTTATLLRQAVACHRAGDLAAARAGYEAVLVQDPRQADALHLLGVLQDQAGDHAGAVALIERAIAVQPAEAAFHGNLATALLALGRSDDAAERYMHALSLDPDYVEGHYNLANLLRREGATASAWRHYEETLRLQPDHVQARNNLAMLLWEDLGETAAAAQQFELLRKTAPDWAAGRMNEGLLRLAGGDYAHGWRDYEWRWRNPDYRERDWGLGLPRWDGRPRPGASLLLWGEQGAGDQILYGTMLEDAQRVSGARLIVAVEPRLVDLFARSFAGREVSVVARGTKVAAAAQCPFGSLGHFLRRSEADFAGKGRYLVADARRVQILKTEYHRIAGPDRRVIGLAWRSGNVSIGAQKSIAPALLAPALARPDILWLCLQYGDVADDLALLREQGVAIHHDPAIDGFADLDGLAAQLAALDGVVSVSTTAVHLAGGLGVPTRLLLPRGRGRLWYWPGEGADSRWYDSVSILRQERPDDWSGVLAAVNQAFSS